MRGSGGKRPFLAHTIPTLRLPYDNKCISPSFVLGLHIYPSAFSRINISFRTCPIHSFLFVSPSFKQFFYCVLFISSSFHLSPFLSIHSSSLCTCLCPVLSPEHSSMFPFLPVSSFPPLPSPPQLVIPCSPTQPLASNAISTPCSPNLDCATVTGHIDVQRLSQQGHHNPKHFQINFLKICRH